MKLHNLLFFVVALMSSITLAQNSDLNLREQVEFKKAWEQSQASGLGSNANFAGKVSLSRTFAKYGTGTGQLLTVYKVAFKREKNHEYYVEVTPMWPDPESKNPTELLPHNPVYLDEVKYLTDDEALGELLKKGVEIPADDGLKKALTDREKEEDHEIFYSPDGPNKPVKAKAFRIRILMPVANKSGKKYMSAEFLLELAHASPR